MSPPPSKRRGPWAPTVMVGHEGEDRALTEVTPEAREKQRETSHLARQRGNAATAHCMPGHSAGQGFATPAPALLLPVFLLAGLQWPLRSPGSSSRPWPSTHTSVKVLSTLPYASSYGRCSSRGQACSSSCLPPCVSPLRVPSRPSKPWLAAWMVLPASQLSQLCSSP